MNIKKQVNQIVEFIQKSSILDDNIDELFAPIKDYTDTIGDIITPVKIGITAFNLSRKRKFKRFLEGFAINLKNENLTDENLIKFQKYLSNDSNLEFIAEVIESSIKSKSSKCSAIMGYYASLILSKSIDVQYQDLVMLDALTNINDMDLKNFYFLYKKLKNSKTVGFRVYDMNDEFNNFLIPKFELENTIEKLKGLQVLGYDVGGLSNVGNAWGAFEFNEYSHHFYKTIVDSKILETDSII